MNSLKEFIQSTEGLVTAVAAMITALVSLLQIIKKGVIDSKVSNQRKPKQTTSPSLWAQVLKTPVFVIFLLTVIISASIFITRASLPPKPINEQLTTDAWNHFNGGRYDEAIQKAQECINLFEGQAIREQQEFTSNKIPRPKLGSVSKDQQTQIFSHGSLNDVATCYFIKGQALERLYRINDAKEAYRHAQDFPHACTYDKSNGFWSPSDAASDRLAQLQ